MLPCLRREGEALDVHVAELMPDDALYHVGQGFKAGGDEVVHEMTTAEYDRLVKRVANAISSILRANMLRAEVGRGMRPDMDTIMAKKAIEIVLSHVGVNVDKV